MASERLEDDVMFANTPVSERSSTGSGFSTLLLGQDRNHLCVKAIDMFENLELYQSGLNLSLRKLE